MVKWHSLYYVECPIAVWFYFTLELREELIIQNNCPLHFQNCKHLKAPLILCCEMKEHTKTAAGMRAQYKVLKDKNVSLQQYKKLPHEDNAHLQSLVDENVSIDETDLGMEREKLGKRKEQELTAFAKEISKEALIDIINASSPEGNNTIVLRRVVTPTINMSEKMVLV